MCLCAALLIFWFQTDFGGTSEAKIQPAVTGREIQLLLIFLIMVTRWSRSSSKFYALIDQNLTGLLMWKFYAASWNLLTLIAEADRVLCQHWCFNCLFPLDVHCVPYNATFKRLVRLNYNRKRPKWQRTKPRGQTRETQRKCWRHAQKQRWQNGTHPSHSGRYRRRNLETLKSEKGNESGKTLQYR